MLLGRATEALKERILALAGDRDVCEAVGRRARVAFERQWDKARAIAKWEALLRCVGKSIVSGRDR